MTRSITRPPEAVAQADLRQLSDVALGIVEDGRQHVRRNDTRPLALWGPGGAAATFYMSFAASMLKLRVKQGLHQLWNAENVGHAGRSSRAYPVHRRAALAISGERRITGLWVTRLYSGDVDGDGVEELVLARDSGVLEVYTPGGLRWTHQPQLELGAPLDFCRISTLYTSLPGWRALYVVLGVGPNPVAGECATQAPARQFAVVRIDARGCHDVVLQGLADTTYELLGLGGINRPGSRVLDELVSLTRADPDGPVLMTRHLPDGSALQAPREVYAPLPEDTFHFSFVAQSEQAVAQSSGLDELVFIAPAKPANWIRRVELREVLPPSARLATLLGVVGRSGAHRALLVGHDGIYALDEAGRAYEWSSQGEGSLTEVAAALTFDDSDTVAGTKMTGGASRPGVIHVGLATAADQPALVVVESQPPRAVNISDDELRDAATGVLGAPTGSILDRLRDDPRDEDLELRLPGLFTLPQTLRARIERAKRALTTRQSGRTSPTPGKTDHVNLPSDAELESIDSLSALHKMSPALWAEVLTLWRGDIRAAVVRALFGPHLSYLERRVGRVGRVGESEPEWDCPTGSHEVDKNAWRKWVLEHVNHGETRVSLVALSGRTLRTCTIAGFSPDLADPELRMPKVAVHVSPSHVYAVLPLAGNRGGSSLGDLNIHQFEVSCPL